MTWIDVAKHAYHITFIEQAIFKSGRQPANYFGTGGFVFLQQLEQLERLCSKNTLYYWVILDSKSKEDKVKVTKLKNLPKLQILKFWNKHDTRHTFWSCLIRCTNMKWIRRVLFRIQSGHDSVHRRTDGRADVQTEGRTDEVNPVYTPFQLRWSGGIITPYPYVIDPPPRWFWCRYESSISIGLIHFQPQATEFGELWLKLKIDDLMQKMCKTIANALVLRLLCVKTSKYTP